MFHAPGARVVAYAALGTVFTVKIKEEPRLPLNWFADNDEVLAIEDDAGLVGTITATAKGTSTIEWRNRRPQGTLVIEVFEEPTVSVGMSFGNVRDRQA